MPAPGIAIVKATTADLKTIKALGIQTFSESFAYANTEEDMRSYLEKNFNEPVLRKELDNPEIEYYLAFKDTEPVGYVKLNFGKTQNEQLDTSSLEIERLYVLKDYQNEKIGQMLMQTAIDVGRRHQLETLWLGVWEHNPGAIKFYGRNNFVAFGKHPFMLGKDKQTDILMKRSL